MPLFTRLFFLLLFLAAGVPAGARPLSVIQAFPEGETRHLAQVVVRFSEDMRPLGVTEQDAATSPLRLEAPGGELPAGSWRWLDPATLAYLFDRPVDIPLRLEARVAADAEALSGNRPDGEKAWSLSTPPLRFSVSGGEFLPPENASFFLSANYVPDGDALRAGLSLLLDGRDVPFEIARETGAASARGEFAWSCRVDVKESLPPDKTLELRLAAGITAGKGSLPAGETSFSLPTFQNLRLEMWNAGSAGGDDPASLVSPQSALVLRFNNPVRYEDLLAHLEIDPPAEIPQEAEPRFSSSRTAFFLPCRWEARTPYTVAVTPGLRDEYGGILSSPVRFSLATGDFSPLFPHLEEEYVLESSLGGIFPLLTRNVSPVVLKLGGLSRDGKQPDEEIILDYSGRPNATIREMLNIPEMLGFSGPEEMPGRSVRMSAAGTHGESSFTQETTLQITNLGLDLKIGRGTGLVWVTDMDKGRPLPGVELSLLNRDGILWSGVSDVDGVAEIPGIAAPGDDIRLIAAKDGDRVELSPARMALASPYGDYVPPNPLLRFWRIHALAQSPLYRPGEEVRFVLFARVFDRADDLPAPDWMPLAHDNLRVRVLDGRGRVVHSLQARTNAHGSVDGAFTLPAEAALGEYTVEADAAALESPAMAPAFRVASFRPPDFGVNLSAPASRPKNLPGERLPDVEVDAAYLSGAGMPGAPVSLAIRRSVVPFAPPRLDGYKTGYNADPFSGRFHYDYIDSRDRTENVAELAAVLDGDGRAAIPLPALDAEPGRTAKISLEATVTDAAGLAGQDAADFLLHPSAFYVGIRGPRFLPAGQEAVLEFKAASWDDRPLSGVDVRVTAERYVGNETDGPLWEKSLKLAGPEGEKLPVSFEKSGQYCISAFITDPQGRENVSRFMLMVPGAFLEWLRVRPGTDLELVADEEEYSPGQSAKIAVNSPFEQGLALISVERDSVLRYELREISGPSPVLIVPLTAAEAPYVFVSVTLIRGRTAPPPQGADFGGREDAGAPRVAFGAVCLPVSADEPGLLVSLEADAAEYRPGGTVTVTAGVAGDPDRKPRQSQVTLLAVDERVLLAAGGADGYDPGKTFTRLRSHGIRNADTRTRLLDLALPMQRNMDSALPRTAAPLREISAGPPLRDEDGALRQDFSPLVFWLAQGRTDERGRLTASFSLPDTLTSYRLVAVAAGDGRQFATAGLSVRAGKPLQLLSAMPRFATQGDRLLARVLVQNMGASPGEALVHAEAEGAVLGENSASVPLDAGESGVASFPLSVSEAGNALLRVRGSLGKESDAAEFVLPVKPAAPLAATAASGLLRSGESRVLPVLPPSPLDGRSRLEVVFAPSPAVGMPAAAREILDYPWECLEQRLTKAWARSLRLRHGDLLGLPADPADEENIRIALDSASQFQQPDGGLSLWPGSHSSSFYLTAYALLVHSRLETAALSPEVAAEARRYLAGQLEKHAGLSPGEREPSITAEALALLVLAESDSYAAQRRFHNVLEAAEAMRGCSPMAWGCLLLAAGALPDAPGLQRRILSSLEKTAAVTPGHLHFAAAGHASYGASMGSDLRDNGLVLAALTRTAPDYPRIDALASWIGQGLGETRRLSTQEGIFGLWGLTDYLTSLGGNRPVTLQAVWNQRDAMTKTFSRVTDPPFVWVLGADKLPAGQSAELALTARQGDPLWTARLLSAPPSAPAFPENAGFTVARRWNRPPPWNMGDVVEVELTLVVPATRRHVLLFDPFPAGLEPLRATRVDLAEEAPARQPIRPIWEREETRDDGVLLYASSLDPGVYTYSYKLRAAAPGVFVQRAASVEEMYSPEVFGRSAGSVVRVNESEHALRQ